MREMNDEENGNRIRIRIAHCERKKKIERHDRGDIFPISSFLFPLS